MPINPLTMQRIWNDCVCSCGSTCAWPEHVACRLPWRPGTPKVICLPSWGRKTRNWEWPANACALCYPLIALKIALLASSKLWGKAYITRYGTSYSTFHGISDYVAPHTISGFSFYYAVTKKLGLLCSLCGHLFCCISIHLYSKTFYEKLTPTKMNCIC